MDTRLPSAIATTPIHPGATEVANGLDDDCDGELGSWVAYGGPLGTEGIGVCMAGIVSELPDGTLGPIVREATPGVEVADNGLDDDCDGSTDEALGEDADGDGYTVALGDCDGGIRLLSERAVSGAGRIRTLDREAGTPSLKWATGASS